MFNQPSDTVDLDLPPVLRDDVDQEVALLKLQGKTPRRSFIARRMSHQPAIFGDDVPVGATPLWAGEPLPDPAVTDQLIDWAFTQSEAIASATFDFLEYPTDEGLEELLVVLQGEGFELFTMKAPKERSLTQTVLSLLRSGPLPVEELYRVIRETYSSARPEAAVRQVLRRLSRAGTITLEADIVTLLS